LLKLGDGGDSTSGSDSAPSDDNLPQAELNKNLPVEEKKVTKKKVVPIKQITLAS
jgi:hypothetical protein